MTKRTTMLIVAGAAAALAFGCTLRSVSVQAHGDHYPHGRHIHSRTCGHYYDGHAWVSIGHGHHHGPGCGHYWSDHGWVRVGRTVVVDRPHRSRVVHVDECRHHRGCPHVYHDGSWITISAGHRHGDGCGHRFLDGRWVVVRGSGHDHGRSPGKVRVRGGGHVHDARCGCVWNRNRWIVVGGGHVHGPRCGHVYIEGRWSIR